jgi:hypothetical protein
MQTRVPATVEARKQQNHNTQQPAQLLVEQPSSFENHSPQAAQLISHQALMNNSPPQQRMQVMQTKTNNSAQALQMRTLGARMTDGGVTQRKEVEEPLQAQVDNGAVQREEVVIASEAPKPNNTGLPDNLKSGIESLSGMSMDHVKVHYNSSQPAQLNAHAYAQGGEIHVAPGQEQHVPHEAWHVVQQAQGRVKPTMQMKGGVAVNDDVGFETEADVMGARALESGQRITQRRENNLLAQEMPIANNFKTVQRVIDTGVAGINGWAQVEEMPAAGNFTAYPNASRMVTAMTATTPAADPPGAQAIRDLDDGYLRNPATGHNLTRMHAIRGRFGGPGEADNMFLGTALSNNFSDQSHYRLVESPLQNFLQNPDAGETRGFRYSVTGVQNAPPAYMANRIGNAPQAHQAALNAFANVYMPAQFQCSALLYITRTEGGEQVTRKSGQRQQMVTTDVGVDNDDDNGGELSEDEEEVEAGGGDAMDVVEEDGDGDDDGDDAVLGAGGGEAMEGGED